MALADLLAKCKAVFSFSGVAIPGEAALAVDLIGRLKLNIHINHGDCLTADLATCV